MTLTQGEKKIVEKTEDSLKAKQAYYIRTKTALKVWLTDLGRVGRRTVDQSSALKEG